MSILSRRLLLAFAAFGLAAASTSTVVHYKLLTNPGYTSFCDVNATVSCTQAYLSRYGSFLGVPVAVAGLFYFLLILLLVAIGGGESPVSASPFRRTSSRSPRSASRSRCILPGLPTFN